MALRHRPPLHTAARNSLNETNPDTQVPLPFSITNPIQILPSNVHVRQCLQLPQRIAQTLKRVNSTVPSATSHILS
jgi:hypothetical protein